LQHWFNSRGLTASSSVGLSVHITVDEEGNLDAESCVEKDQLFLINPMTHTVTRSSGENNVQRYGCSTIRKVLSGQAPGFS
jgi:hypothetical protein